MSDETTVISKEVKLSAAKRALLEKRLRGGGIIKAQAPSIPRQPGVPWLGKSAHRA